MLKRLTIDGFKSLVDFSVELEPLTLLVGENGVGKSTILQAVDLLSHLISTPLASYLELREWTYPDLVHLKSSGMSIRFEMDVEVTPAGQAGPVLVRWTVELGARRYPGIASERVEAAGKPLLERHGSSMWRWLPDGSEEPHVKQSSGTSYLGSVDPEDPEDQAKFPTLVALASWVKRISPYVSISPRSIGAARASTTLGYQGERLAGFIAHLQAKRPDGFERVQERLRSRYARFVSMRAKRRGPGWHDLLVTERLGRDTIDLHPQQLSDGLIRLIAIAAMPEQDPSLLLLDELENGIHPELAGSLVGLLKDVAKEGVQALATTHSPMLVNYVDDPRRVILVSRGPDGGPTTMRFSESRAYEKLGNYMGLGEVWVNSGETKLGKRS